ncbi:MAG: T9SS type A sorting domain-containing protein, partial [Saprospiraceae bacterium]|nr:T9SS type A sorting domain-containing protein [Saprospiraceae bacterium]
LVEAGHTVVVEPLLNDEGSAGSLKIHALPVVNHGVAYLLDQARIHFTPEPGFEGIAHVNYVVCDALNTCQTGTVHIGVHNGLPNTAPLQVYTNKNTPISIPLNFGGSVVAQNPVHGAVAVLAGNAVLYTPESGFQGMDQFKLKFQVNGNSYYKEVIVKVYATQPANAMAVDDVVFTPKNTPITFNVRSNDVGNLQVRQWVTPPGFPGTLSAVNGSGNVTFTPSSGFSGVATFQYKIGSALATSVEIATVSVVVDNLALPTKLPYRISAVSGTPLVLEYNIPYRPFSFQIISPTEHGSLVVYPGLTTQTINGQSVSGYNLIVYTPEPGFSGLDNAAILYCGPNGECQSCKMKFDVKIPAGNEPDCVYSCVWPGDVDADGIVSSRDLLPLGFVMGEFGPARNQSDTEWYGHQSADWSTIFSALTHNPKHADTDGNGAINSDDILELESNFNIVHNFVKPAVRTGKGLPFTMNVLNQEIELGVPIIIEIGLGTEQAPAQDVYGFTFDITLAPDLVDSIFEMNFFKNSWLNLNAPYLTLAEKKSLGKFEVAFTRTNGAPTSGQGIIGIAELVIIDIIDVGGQDGRSSITLEPTIEMSDGSALLCDPIVLQLPVRDRNKTMTSTKTDSWMVFPSPASNELKVVWEQDQQTEVHLLVMDMHGRICSEQTGLSSGFAALDIRSLPSGIYSLQMQFGNTVETKRFQVVK